MWGAGASMLRWAGGCSPKQTRKADFLRNICLGKILREFSSFSTLLAAPAALWWDGMGEKEMHVPLHWANVPEPCGKESGYSNTWDLPQICKVSSKLHGLSESRLHQSYNGCTRVHLICLLWDAMKKISLFVLSIFVFFSLLPKEGFSLLVSDRFIKFFDRLPIKAQPLR